MPLVPFHQLMAAAETGNYAVGYFESWNLESLLAAADAAEEARSPVILGFSGISLTHPNRIVNDPLSVYAAMGLDVCRKPLRAGLSAVQRIAELGFGAGCDRPRVQSGDV